jgi:hypothetical protein
MIHRVCVMASSLPLADTLLRQAEHLHGQVGQAALSPGMPKPAFPREHVAARLEVCLACPEFSQARTCCDWFRNCHARDRWLDQVVGIGPPCHRWPT